jgi:hypothetical protein
VTTLIRHVAGTGLTTPDGGQPFLGVPLLDVSIITQDLDRPAPSGGNGVPVAVRLEASAESVWIVEAQPKDEAKLDLKPKNVSIGSDEVIVIFGD